MVRIDNNDRITTVRLLAHIQTHINNINKILREEENPDGNLDATYVAGRRTAAMAEGVILMKKWRWLWEDVNQLNQTPETAYTDAEIDAIDEDIRTREDE